MEEGTPSLYEPWTEFDLLDLKKYFKEFERKYKGDKLIKVIANELRRNEDDVANKLKERVADWGIPKPIEPHTFTKITDIKQDAIADEIAVLRVDNKNLQAMNERLKKEIREREEQHQKKIMEISNQKLTLDPNKHFIRCPHCAWLWEIQRVIE